MAAIVFVSAGGGSLVDLDGTFLIQLGLFFAMFAFLYALLFRPVVRLIEARREATDGTRRRALELQEEAARLSEELDRQILDIRTSASAERDRRVEEARRREREVSERAREEARAAVERARRKMEREADEARREMESRLEDLASSAAARVLGRALSGGAR